MRVRIALYDSQQVLFIEHHHFMYCLDEDIEQSLTFVAANGQVFLGIGGAHSTGDSSASGITACNRETTNTDPGRDLVITEIRRTTARACFAIFFG